MSTHDPGVGIETQPEYGADGPRGKLLLYAAGCKALLRVTQEIQDALQKGVDTTKLLAFLENRGKLIDTMDDLKAAFAGIQPFEPQHVELRREIRNDIQEILLLDEHIKEILRQRVEQLRQEIELTRALRRRNRAYLTSGRRLRLHPLFIDRRR